MVETFGSIPACAGEPRPSLLANDRTKVYPRVCGGTVEAVAVGLADAGLSPRVRGNPSLLATCSPNTGSIPACAGEPLPQPSSKCSQQVYPRVCGGTCFTVMSGDRSRGLSPRVRGNPLVVSDGGDFLGSIPACAGEPRGARFGGCGRKVYPRVCGGTDLVGHSGAPVEVYPRVCGGTAKPQRPVGLSEGLSPRVRGNRVVERLLRSCCGSIPACAGEPCHCYLPFG